MMTSKLLAIKPLPEEIFKSESSKREARTKILLIEDEIIARSQLAELLTTHNFDVLKAQHGKRGLSLALSNRLIEVLVVDIVMRGELDGISAAIQIQSQRPEIGLIFVTAFPDSPEYRDRVKRSGLRVAAWIRKPCIGPKLKLLLDTINSELKKVPIRETIFTFRQQGLDKNTILKIIAHYDREVSDELINQLKIEDFFEPDHEIDELYSKIESLSSESDDLSDIKKEVRSSLLKRLRDLQTQEAQRLRRSIENTAPLLPGLGYALYEQFKNKEDDIEE